MTTENYLLRDDLNLQACPFCGHVPIDEMDFLHPIPTFWREDGGMRHYIDFNDPRGSQGQVWSLSCLTHEGGCGAEVTGDSRDEAIAAWNRRADRIAELEAEVTRLRHIEFAWNEWQDKTEWVQKSAKPRELGMHRVDVLTGRIEKAEAQRDKLLDALKWYVANDDTNEGDEPMSDKGGCSWDQINEFWIEGQRRAIAAIAEVEGR